MYKKIENYTIHEALGSGQYGKVYKGYDTQNGFLVAIKVVNSKKFKEVEQLEVFTMNEIQTLAKISNSNIVKFYEMLVTTNNRYFVYEYCNGGNLEDLLKSKGRFSENEALIIFRFFQIFLKKKNILRKIIEFIFI